MGNWRTGLSWDAHDPLANNWRYSPHFLPAARRHREDATCTTAHCHFLVRQHQGFEKPEDSDVPEFTIEVAYKTHDHVGNPVTPGWRYVLKWMENGAFKQVRNYGFIDRDAAVQAARYEARNIAKTLLPVHVETYTPEV